jgi:hypothetical protein
LAVTLEEESLEHHPCLRPVQLAAIIPALELILQPPEMEAELIVAVEAAAAALAQMQLTRAMVIFRAPVAVEEALTLTVQNLHIALLLMVLME